MAVVSREISGGGTLPGYRIIAGVIWATGLFMTYNFLDQITELGAGQTVIAAVVCQVILTWGQSPVWNGRGGLIGWVALSLDALINFGGIMFFVANIDQAGSVIALAGSFGADGGDWPMWVKAIIALVLSAIVAGLPEYFWKRG
jgi:hypothetical protein